MANALYNVVTKLMHYENIAQSLKKRSDLCVGVTSCIVRLRVLLIKLTRIYGKINAAVSYLKIFILNVLTINDTPRVEISD